MNEFADVAEFFSILIQNLKQGTITIDAPLDSITRRTAWNYLAYVDNRKGALAEGYDFWQSVDSLALKTQGITQNQRYSQSQEFPDFIFKVREHNGQLVCGSLLESKDTMGGTISSFNSTIPTGTKNLKEIDVINNSTIVSKISEIKDGKLANNPFYMTYQRRCFYLIRTHKGSLRTKISLVDGSFFETVPKDRLIYQLFLNILEKHRIDKKLNIPEKTFKDIKGVLSQITDQTIIAGSQNIESASIKPRLRIMAEVNPEGNPHSSHYPQIVDKTVNFIITQKVFSESLEKYLLRQVPDLEKIVIQHKRNGEYVVFQYKVDR